MISVMTPAGVILRSIRREFQTAKCHQLVIHGCINKLHEFLCPLGLARKQLTNRNTDHLFLRVDKEEPIKDRAPSESTGRTGTRLAVRPLDREAQAEVAGIPAEEPARYG